MQSSCKISSVQQSFIKTLIEHGNRYLGYFTQLRQFSVRFQRIRRPLLLLFHSITHSILNQDPQSSILTYNQVLQDQHPNNVSYIRHITINPKYHKQTIKSVSHLSVSRTTHHILFSILHLDTVTLFVVGRIFVIVGCMYYHHHYHVLRPSQSTEN